MIWKTLNSRNYRKASESSIFLRRYTIIFEMKFEIVTCQSTSESKHTRSLYWWSQSWSVSRRHLQSSTREKIDLKSRRSKFRKRRRLAIYRSSSSHFSRNESERMSNRRRRTKATSNAEIVIKRIIINLTVRSSQKKWRISKRFFTTIDSRERR